MPHPDTIPAKGPPPSYHKRPETPAEQLWRLRRQLMHLEADIRRTEAMIRDYSACGSENWAAATASQLELFVGRRDEIQRQIQEVEHV